MSVATWRGVLLLVASGEGWYGGFSGSGASSAPDSGGGGDGAMV